MTRSTHPLNLPVLAPPCYSSQNAWDLYRMGLDYSAGDGFTFCTDCTPQHKAKMERLNRCKYPGTMFVLVGTVTVGRRRIGQ